jgi:hypothetical protein
MATIDRPKEAQSNIDSNFYVSFDISSKINVEVKTKRKI